MISGPPDVVAPARLCAHGAWFVYGLWDPIITAISTTHHFPLCQLVRAFMRAGSSFSDQDLGVNPSHEGACYDIFPVYWYDIVGQSSKSLGTPWCVCKAVLY